MTGDPTAPLLGSAKQPAPKLHYSIRATKLVHDRIATIMSFVYSQKPLANMVEANFHGEWKYLNRVLFEIPEARAERALIELGLYIRIIDDAEKVSQAFTQIPIGHIDHTDGTTSDLLIREVANKIIHAERFEWNKSATPPTVACLASATQRKRFNWSKASIDLVRLSGFCGALAG